MFFRSSHHKTWGYIFQTKKWLWGKYESNKNWKKFIILIPFKLKQKSELHEKQRFEQLYPSSHLFFYSILPLSLLFLYQTVYLNHNSPPCFVFLAFHLSFIHNTHVKHYQTVCWRQLPPPPQNGSIIINIFQTPFHIIAIFVENKE